MYASQGKMTFDENLVNKEQRSLFVTKIDGSLR